MVCSLRLNNTLHQRKSESFPLKFALAFGFILSVYFSFSLMKIL